MVVWTFKRTDRITYLLIRNISQVYLYFIVSAFYNNFSVSGMLMIQHTNCTQFKPSTHRSQGIFVEKETYS